MPTSLAELGCPIPPACPPAQFLKALRMLFDAMVGKTAAGAPEEAMGLVHEAVPHLTPCSVGEKVHSLLIG